MRKNKKKADNILTKRYLDKKIVGISKRFEIIDKRFDSVDKRFEIMDERFDKKI